MEDREWRLTSPTLFPSSLPWLERKFPLLTVEAPLGPGWTSGAPVPSNKQVGWPWGLGWGNKEKTGDLTQVSLSVRRVLFHSLRQNLRISGALYYSQVSELLYFELPWVQTGWCLETKKKLIISLVVFQILVSPSPTLIIYLPSFTLWNPCILSVQWVRQGVVCLLLTQKWNWQIELIFSALPRVKV